MRNFNASVVEITPASHPRLDDLADERVRALKSLALLLLRELEQLENLNPRREILFDEDLSLSEEVQNYEVGLIRAALNRVKGNQRKAARMLGTKVTTLNVKIKRYGIVPGDLPNFTNEA